MQPFLERNSDLGPATRSKLLEILTDGQKCKLQRVELAVTIDLRDNFGDETQCLLATFKAARPFSPHRVHEIQPLAAVGPAPE